MHQNTVYILYDALEHWDIKHIYILIIIEILREKEKDRKTDFKIYKTESYSNGCLIKIWQIILYKHVFIILLLRYSDCTVSIATTIELIDSNIIVQRTAKKIGW